MAIIQRDDALSRLPQTLLQMLVQKENLALQKEDQKLRKADFELRQGEAERQRELQAAALQGAQAAAGLLMQQRPELQETVAGLPAAALPSFLEAAQSFRMGEAQIRGAEAGATSSEVGARVDLATEGDMIAQRRLAVEAAKAGLAQTFAQTHGTTIQNALNQAALNNDPVRVRAAWQMVVESEGELTWGQAANTYGVSTDAIDPNFRLLPLDAKGGSDAAVKAASLYNMMVASNGTINQMIDAGERVSLAGAINRSSTGPIINAISGAFTSDDEDILLQAQRQFTDAYRFFISGQQSSDAEAQRLLFTMMENPNDGPETIRQKRFMRSLTINMAQQVAAGALNPQQAAQRLLDTAIQQGLPEERLNVFREQLSDAVDYTEAGGPFAGFTPSDEPGGGSIANVPDLVDLGLRPGGR